MKLRVVETGYKSPKMVSDRSGGKMILIIPNPIRQGGSHHGIRVKETVAVSFWKKGIQT
jgi:hypothetical protein